MAGTLEGKRIAIIVTDGFEQAELTSPKQALEAAGARVDVVSDRSGTVQGMNHDEKGDRIAVDRDLADADADEYDGVILPGGVVNADAIRLDEKAQAFVRAIDAAGKPLGVICHGAWLLISCDLVDDRTLTSWPSLQDDIRNAGGEWVDREVVRDGLWVSSRKPADLPAFNEALIALFAETPEQATA